MAARKARSERTIARFDPESEVLQVAANNRSRMVLLAEAGQANRLARSKISAKAVDVTSEASLCLFSSS